MTSLATTTARPRAGHVDLRPAFARIRDAAIAAAAASRAAWQSFAEDGQLGPSADLIASRQTGARA